MRDGSGIERSLPFASNAQDGAVGEASVYPHPAATAVHEAAAVQVRHYTVSPGRPAQHNFTDLTIKL